MRRTLIITLILFTLYISAGLETMIGGRKSITDAFYVSTVGLDKAEDKIKLTIVTQSLGPEEETEYTKKQDKYFVTEGKTIFEANRFFTTFMDNKIFWGHVDYILISESLVKNGLDTYLDFFMRDHETRLIAELFIVKEYSAEESIKLVIDSGEDITNTLHVLKEDVGKLSVSGCVPVYEAFSTITDENCGSNVPLLQIIEDEKEETDSTDTKEASVAEDNPKSKRLVLDGYALLDPESSELVGFLTGNDARGFNFAINKIKSGVIVVKDPEGEDVTLEIIKSKTEIIPKFNGDKLEVTFKNKLSTNIAEIQGSTNLFTDENIELLIKQQNEIVKKEVKSAIDFALEHNIDIFPISKVVERKFPVKWDKIKDDWRKIFTEITFNVEVDSQIDRTYSIKDPVLSREDG
ncbi:Ger(x)C family spore germination protein [Mycoplasmatota bacterium zrk1]